MKKIILIGLFITFLWITPVSAQEDGASGHLVLVVPQVVEVTALDGTALVGDFFLVEPSHPTVILVHEIYTTRVSWDVLIDPILSLGYNLLIIDQRGHGASRGSIAWEFAVGDMQIWFDWLRNAVGVRHDAITVIGSSMGSSIATVGCANDALCRGVISISPSWNYFGIGVERAFREQLINRHVLLIYAQRDRYPALGVPRILETATGHVEEKVYSGNTHGMHLFGRYGDDLTETILNWLRTYGA